MTDDRSDDPSRRDPDSADSTDDAADAAVRALLGEARVTDLMPAEVADRIGRALAAAPGPDPAAPAGVVRLRRRLVAGLVAAAVVVLGGAALATQVTLSGGTDDRATSGSAMSKAAEDAGTDTGTGSVAGGSREPALTPGPSPQAPDDLPGRSRLPALRSDSFAADARALVAAVPWTATVGRTPATEDGATATERTGCARPATAGPDADLREISLDGRLVTLLVDPPSADPRHATAYSCDRARELASAVLPR